LADFANVDGLGREIASISQSAKIYKTLEEIKMSMPPNGDVMSQCRSKPHYYITGTSMIQHYSSFFDDTTYQIPILLMGPHLQHLWR
jgi:hypothetical protein